MGRPPLKWPCGTRYGTRAETGKDPWTVQLSTPNRLGSRYGTTFYVYTDSCTALRHTSYRASKAQLVRTTLANTITIGRAPVRAGQRRRHRQRSGRIESVGLEAFGFR